MKFGNSLLLLALTAGLAVLAATNVRPVASSSPDVRMEDADAWFV